jgi:hypothetical protein
LSLAEKAELLEATIVDYKKAVGEWKEKDKDIAISIMHEGKAVDALLKDIKAGKDANVTHVQSVGVLVKKLTSRKQAPAPPTAKPIVKQSLAGSGAPANFPMKKPPADLSSIDFDKIAQLGRIDDSLDDIDVEDLELNEDEMLELGLGSHSKPAANTKPAATTTSAKQATNTKPAANTKPIPTVVAVAAAHHAAESQADVSIDDEDAAAISDSEIDLDAALASPPKRGSTFRGSQGSPQKSSTSSSPQSTGSGRKASATGSKDTTAVDFNTDPKGYVR